MKKVIISLLLLLNAELFALGDQVSGGVDSYTIVNNSSYIIKHGSFELKSGDDVTKDNDKYEDFVRYQVSKNPLVIMKRDPSTGDIVIEDINNSK